MRLCVRWLHVCAGEEKRTLRKSAFCARTLTERRILGADPHGKAHSARPPTCRMRLLVRPTRKMRLSVTSPVQNALFRESPVAEWGTCVRCCDAIRRGVNPHKPPKSLFLHHSLTSSGTGVAHSVTPSGNQAYARHTEVAASIRRGCSPIAPEPPPRCSGVCMGERVTLTACARIALFMHETPWRHNPRRRSGIIEADIR